MKSTNTGLKQLKGQLPDQTVVAHKTGSSGTNKKTGITAALNDVGVVLLPSGEYFVISVFVTHSKENQETNERIISDIAKAAWDFLQELINYSNTSGSVVPFLSDHQYFSVFFEIFVLMLPL